VSTDDSIKNMQNNYGYKGPVVTRKTTPGVGKTLADSLTDLLNNNLKMTLTDALGLSKDPEDAVVYQHYSWWSGSDSDGSYIPSCINWSSDSYDHKGTYGTLATNTTYLGGPVSIGGKTRYDLCGQSKYNLCACTTYEMPVTPTLEPTEKPTEKPTTPVPSYTGKYTKLYTAGKHTANLGTRDNIDTICKNVEPSVCIPGSTHGFISIDDNDSIKNMPINYGYDISTEIIGNKPTGTLLGYHTDPITGRMVELSELYPEGGPSHTIATNWDDMLDNSIDTMLKISLGDGDPDVSSSTRWWSGSKPDGSVDYTCNKWTTSSVKYPGVTVTTGLFDDEASWLNDDPNCTGTSCTKKSWISEMNNLNCTTNKLLLLCACATDSK
jgi:hypothetical protein